MLPPRKNAARESDGISDSFNGSNGAGLQGRAIHQDGVKLCLTVAIEMSPYACVKDGIVLEFDNGLFARIDRQPSRLQNLPGSFQGSRDTVAGRGLNFRSDCSCTAVDDQSEVTHR